MSVEVSTLTFSVMVKITGDRFKGRNLASQKSMKVRPTSVRVRESLFGILGERIGGADVLDLFAGIGTIGIEALSRGASKVIFVENDRQVARVIKKNLEILGEDNDNQISLLPALNFIRRYSGRKRRFDFIYADPPYTFDKHEEVLSALSHGGLLKKNGILVIEHSKKDIFRETFRYIKKIRVKIISDSCLSFYEMRDPDE